MRNISNFVQISSVLAQRSTSPTRLLLLSRPGKGPVVWHPSKMLSSQNGYFSRTARQRTRHNRLSENPVDYTVCIFLQQRVYQKRKFNTVEELKRAISVATFHWQ